MLRSTSAVAREPSEVFAIPRGDFLAVIEARPKLMRRVLETTARRLSVSSERESALAFQNAPARLARVLLQLDRQASALPGEHSTFHVVGLVSSSDQHFGGRMAAAARGAHADEFLVFG